MFLPDLKIKTGSRAVIFFTLPEWNYAKNRLFMNKKAGFLNLKIRYNEKALILGPLMGAPLVGIVIEVLNSLGIKEIIGVGWAGKVNPRLIKGDLFLPTKAYSLEGVSRFYFPKKRVFYPDRNIFKKVEKEIAKRISFKRGEILSVDAPLIFEKEKMHLHRWRNKVEAIDMETSALFSVAHSLQMKVMALHFIIDEVGIFSRKKPEEEIKIKREKVFEVLKDFLDYKI